MEEFKVIKTQRKSVLTRHINTLSRLLVEEDIDKVVERLKSLSQIFDELESAHYSYLDSLDAVKSSDLCDQSEKWFVEVTDMYTRSVSKAKLWLGEHGYVNAKHEAKPIVQSPEPKSESLTSELMHMMNLPKVEIPTFCGDPRDYHMFINLFYQLVGDVSLGDQIKLTRLLQYMSGVAADSVKHCTLMSGSAGYAEARKVLKTRFGNSQLIIRSVIHDLKNGGNAFRCYELRKLADDVNTAYQTLTKLGAYTEINNQIFIQDILSRCHGQIRSRWRKYALDTYESSSEYPSFQLFVNFMNKIAQEACDPVYGYDNFKVTNKPTVNSIVNSPNLEMSVKDKPTLLYDPCSLCQGSHYITKCKDFKSMTPEQRYRFVRERRLCFSCLSSKHMINNCTRNVLCDIDGCKRKHSRFIHTSVSNNANSLLAQGQVVVDQSQRCQIDQSVPKHVNSCTTTGGFVYLPMVPVLVNGYEPAIALLDTGSSCSLITERLVNKLRLKSEPSSCELKTIGSSKHMSRLVSFSLKSIKGNDQCLIHHACVISDIPADTPASDVQLTKYSHLQDLPLSHLKPGVTADIIIGQDHPECLVPYDVRRGKAKEPYATLTRFGWALQGPVGNDVYNRPMFNNHVTLKHIDDQLRSLYMVEGEDESEWAWSAEDRKVFDMWSDECVHDGERYTIPPPWKPGKPCFPNNLPLARARLQGTLKKLDKTGTYAAYHEGINKLLADGHAEQVPDDSISRDDGAVWYLPHHALFSDSKPGKLRIVFDCAAMYDGVCLNSECYREPDMINKLLHVLLRFRQYQYAVMADIKSMYLQVRIPMDDRDCLRFLWKENGKEVHYRMTSHLFGGVWCVSSSAYALKRTLEDFCISSFVQDAVSKSMYVDDLLRSLPRKEEMSELIRESKITLAKGGFPLTKFIVNDSELLGDIPEVDRAQEVKVIVPEQCSKALGLGWDISSDQFFYVRKDVMHVRVVSKRHMLSCVASMYDPLGLLVPVIILGRMLFQEASREKVPWDDPVSQGLSDRWLAWWDCMREITSLRFDRCVVPCQFSDGALELHHFCDGSQLAYGVCSYVRILNKSGFIHVQLLMGKARLTPLNPITIPRTELCAAVMAVKMDELLRRELELQFLLSVFWTDSQVVLHYITSETLRFRVFVANRVSLIRTKTNAEQWHHVSSRCNPADILTRGCTPERLPESWVRGPDFLHRHRDSWPRELVVRPDVCMEDCELKRHHSTTSCVSVEDHPLDILIDHYSDVSRLHRALAWLIRWRDMLRDKAVSEKLLTLAEVNNAENILIIRVQSNEYANEVESLSRGQPVKKSSHIAALDPMLIDGMIVVGGRLKHAHLAFSLRHPVVLPPRHAYSKLVLWNAHNRAHLGTEWVLSHVRQRFWIPGARGELRSIRRKCVTCQRLFDKPGFQKMADLPEERCSPSKAVFSDVGCDLFGPFHVVQGRSTVKRYGCVFTCMAVRAVHLEVLPSLETDTFINGFRRFCSRRGHPCTVRSDRGTNLVGACAELAKEMKKLDEDRIVVMARCMNVEWVFNPPTASHQGGVWERMIRTVRRILLAVMPVRSITDDVLRTIFCEVENLINGRPLTKVSSDVTDDVPLTPNHFLLAGSNYPIPWGRFSSAEAYRRQWKLVQNVVLSFWKRWVRQYIPSLQSRQKWLSDKPDLKEGDLVMLMDESSPRGCWPMGRVIEVHSGRDGHVRSVRLSVRGTCLVRPITKLVRLELD